MTAIEYIMLKYNISEEEAMRVARYAGEDYYENFNKYQGLDQRYRTYNDMFLSRVEKYFRIRSLK